MKGEIKQLYKDVKQGAQNVKKRLKYRSHGKIQSNIKKVSYWARYPYLRLLVVVVISFFNFSVFIEDPTLYSNMEVSIPVIGHVLLLMAARWPPVLSELIVICYSLLVAAVVFGEGWLIYWDSNIGNVGRKVSRSPVDSETMLANEGMSIFFVEGC